MVCAFETADSSFLLMTARKILNNFTDIHLPPFCSSSCRCCEKTSERQVSRSRNRSDRCADPSLIITSDFQRVKFNFLSCAVIIMSVLALQVHLTSSTNSSSSSSSSSMKLQLPIGILVAESCDVTFHSSIKEKVIQAIDDFQAFVKITEGSENSTPLQVDWSIYPYCDTRAVVSNLHKIFGNISVNVVLGLATYDIHSSFIPLAEIYDTAYIPVNAFVLTLAKTQSTSFAPKFSQRSMMLAKVLDMYQWQSVYIIFSNFNFWSNFATYVYFDMTRYDFKVKLAPVISSPVTKEEAVIALSSVGNSKVILLLMDVQDQLSVLAAASSLSMATEHAFFSLTKTPYDLKIQSTIGLTPDVLMQPRFYNDTNSKDVNIFESHFVIAFSFPEEQTINRAATTTTKRRKRDAQADSPSDLSANLRPSTDVDTTQYSSHPTFPYSQSVSLFNTFRSKIDRETKAKNMEFKTPKVQETIQTTDFNGDKPFKFVNILNLNIHAQSKVVNTINPVPIASTMDNSSFAQARMMTTRYDDVISQELNDVTSENLKTTFRVTNLDLSDQAHTTPRLSRSLASDQDGESSNSLFFQSENLYMSSKSNTLSQPLKLDSSNLAVNARSKRDIETFVVTEADVDAIYDTIFLLAYAVHLHTKHTNTVPSSEDLIASIANLSFRGNSGEFQIDLVQQVSFDFSVYDFNVTSGAMEQRIYFEATSSETWVLKEDRRVAWPDGVVLNPDECFKKFPDCNDGLKMSIIAGIVVSGLVVVVVIVLAGVFIRRHWVTKEMTRGPNKVILCAEDLVFVLRRDVVKSSRIMKSRVTLLEKGSAPDLIRGSDPNRSTASINELSDYTETARYNGDLVHVKALNIKGFEMRSRLLAYIKMCRDLRHENLNPYVGFLADPSRPSIIVEYCSRGSLHDIIHNDDFKLDWDFKLSLLTDLVRGIRYLHSSPLKYHGHLTSRSCVIDSRFVLKITDYGVSGIMEKCKAVKVLDPKDLLWSAPELLRDETFLQRGSEKGDIYAMAIIFQEVALRTEPYSTTGLTPEEIVKKLKKPPPLIRPSVTPQAAPPLFIQIMKQCWAESPEMRPSVDEIYDQFKKLTGGKKANIVDTMFKMLEKYSTDLEDIVADRTMQLEEEKKKTDQLLFRMLPSTVAESLKIGRNVEAECFDEVTIYFSDIVGFTTISAMSTPMQVVDLLNDLYSMFDATINDHDVYKVETIGDAYMVVSGLPVRNGNRHAGEIGTLALVLLSHCGKFTIRHMPQVPLRLRIGLHTGSCVAGVVGTTMPRFCLFGDTVNTASRMESSGAAFRIHISEACKVALDELGGYWTEYRGQTELKGKGMHNTYWLIGKDGFDKHLPEPPPLNGDNTHGLDSILGDLKIDFGTELSVPMSDAICKSNSAPNLATPIKAPKLVNPHPSSNDANITNSHPDNLNNVHKNNYKKSKTTTTNVVTADINITGGGEITDVTYSAANQNSGTTTGTGQGRHSESNDSGFGSERKHSEGNEGYSGNWAACSEQNSSEEPIRSNQQVSSRTAGPSSSNGSSRKNYLSGVDVAEDLTTVTEV